jgi:HicB family
MEIKCKRIIDGKTYNTETATQIVGDLTEGVHLEHGGTFLYQTRFGAFFLYSFVRGTGEHDSDEIQPLSPEQARDWLEKKYPYRVDLIENLFGEMPEAGSGETKFTLRMPDSLRERLAERAKANNQSLNAWMVRCLEACADIPPMTGLTGSNREGWRTKGPSD